MTPDTTKRIYMLVGAAGSGKSTHGRRLTTGLPAHAVAVVSSDALREELTGNAANLTVNTRVWEVFHARIEQAIASPVVRVLVLDATFSDPDLRRSVLAFARGVAPGVPREVTGVFVDTPLEECLRRNASRSRRVPEEAIREMHARLQTDPPRRGEGFDRVVVHRPEPHVPAVPVA